MDLIVKQSNISGKGVFAPRDIRKGEVVAVLSGKVVVGEEAIDQKIKEGKEKIDDPLQISDNVFLDLNELSNTFNHSCNPNAGIRKESELFAVRDIFTGEEITFDYSTTIGKDIDLTWEMNCNCRSWNCRKIIGNVLTIPLERIKEYARERALPDFIRIQLNKELR